MAVHALIKLSPLEDTGRREDFAGDPPDVTRKNRKWVPLVRVPDPAFDPAAEALRSKPDVVTADQVTEEREAVPLPIEQQRAENIKKRADNLEADVRAVCDKLRPTGAKPDAGLGLAFDALTPLERNKVARYLLLSNGFDA